MTRILTHFFKKCNFNLTSTEADLKDPEVKKLADEIIETQKKEIKKMNQMIERLQE
ncbi:DUF305 domain-containing protein [Loigolactobacillus coryniformis]|uniref:DUF305 domain-containing protein n=1 Tax=Loigolactobacillus coryniformis TaxID=1610 RepID=UPI002340A009|nr:DUF305 domain-containing protein [Loigolactobacillus coryniformis]